MILSSNAGPGVPKNGQIQISVRIVSQLINMRVEAFLRMCAAYQDQTKKTLRLQNVATY